mmetsp:Transcript_314/g.729  ORF Transcript_314/g.729 Transcript_314/m.729 type:complete len:164 (+) Transcript_314:194-685(+)
MKVEFRIPEASSSPGRTRQTIRQFGDVCRRASSKGSTAAVDGELGEDSRRSLFRSIRSREFKPSRYCLPTVPLLTALVNMETGAEDAHAQLPPVQQELPLLMHLDARVLGDADSCRVILSSGRERTFQASTGLTAALTTAVPAGCEQTAVGTVVALVQVASHE